MSGSPPPSPQMSIYRHSGDENQPLSVAIKTLCDTNEQIQNTICLLLSKTRIIDVRLDDILTRGKTSITKQFLAENMLNLLSSVLSRLCCELIKS